MMEHAQSLASFVNYDGKHNMCKSRSNAPKGIHCLKAKVGNMNLRLLTQDNMDGLLQQRHNSIANALEKHFFCIKPSICEIKLKDKSLLV